MSEIFVAGEVFLRKHYRAFGASAVPLALELIEAERLADEFSRPGAAGARDVRQGIEIDDFGRAVAYWIRERHPGDLRSSAFASDRLVRVPAEEIIHLRLVERWPNTRGEPWLHAVASRLNDLNGYSEAEIVAARGAAAYMAFIKTPDPEGAPVGEQVGNQRVYQMEPGIIEKLAPGEEIVLNNPNRPNPNMDPFTRLMLREIAAGIGVSYESLSRDYSQSNYSSSRLSLIDDRDTWRVLQAWFLRALREPLHREWMGLAVMARAIPGVDLAAYLADQAKYQAVRFKPRGWSWVDPTREVEAYKQAVRCGFTTISDVIAQTGNGSDIEDVLETRRRELELAESMGLSFDTDVSAASTTPPAPAPEGEDAEDEPEGEDDAASADRISRVIPLR
jgi:lambda family phage portal protein